MSPPPAAAVAATLADVLPANLRLGEPNVVGALVAYPIFGVAGRAQYALLSEALGKGAALHEVAELPGSERGGGGFGSTGR